MCRTMLYLFFYVYSIIDTIVNMNCGVELLFLLSCLFFFCVKMVSLWDYINYRNIFWLIAYYLQFIIISRYINFFLLNQSFPSGVRERFFILILEKILYNQIISCIPKNIVLVVFLKPVQKEIRTRKSIGNPTVLDSRMEARF